LRCSIFFNGFKRPIFEGDRVAQFNQHTGLQQPGTQDTLTIDESAVAGNEIVEFVISRQPDKPTMIAANLIVADDDGALVAAPNRNLVSLKLVDCSRRRPTTHRQA